MDETTETPRGSVGYDAPATYAGDLLDRYSFANRIYSIILDTPKDWSVRIGLHGTWGEGKTTVLEYIEEMVAKDGHLSVRVNPWATRTRDELWTYFVEQLFRTLSQNKIDVGIGSWKSILAEKLPWAKRIRSLSQADKRAEVITGIIFSELENTLRPQGETLASIRSGLKGRKLVVLIDDLDRAEPDILPDLLLGLREILDIPNFSYVLAFDLGTVSSALERGRLSIKSGRAFVEKLLDFSFVLPKIDDEQVRALLNFELDRRCDFANRASIKEILPIVPHNPRKIKRFIRHISALRGQIHRHDEDELHWPSIYICQLIRNESEEFLEKLVGLLVSDKFMWMDILSEDNQRQERWRSEIQALLEGCDLDVDVSGHMAKLAEELVRQAGLTRKSQIAYSASIWYRPHAITWKEFRELFRRWQGTASVSLNDWVLEHCDRVGQSATHVAEELFQAAHNHRLNALDRAANSRATADHEQHVSEAKLALELVRELFTQGLDCVGHDYFARSCNLELIVALSAKWAQFDRQSADSELRSYERLVIKECSDVGLQDPEEFLLFLNDSVHRMLDRQSFIDLGNICRPQCEGAVADTVIKDFGKPGAIANYIRKDGFRAQKYVLFDIHGPLWAEPRRRAFFETLRMASEVSDIHVNAYWLLLLLKDELSNFPVGHRSPALELVESQKEFVNELWAAATTHRVQYRALGDLTEARAALLIAGTPDTDLVVPDWLVESEGDFVSD